jgi:hypothetical protein
MLKLFSQALALLTALGALWGGTAHAQNFNCGPNAYTYELRYGGAVAGVRCVKVVDDRSFTFYGEGRWGTYEYRLLGYAIGDIFNGGRNFRGWTGDFYGNGEDGAGFATLTLTATAPISSGPAIIQVRGAYSEDWYRSTGNTAVGYTRLPYGVSRCGGNFEQMWVPAMDGSFHIRCLLHVDGHNNEPAAWYGAGTHGGYPYEHLGTAIFQWDGPRWGSTDLCLSGWHYCGYTGYGALGLSRQSDTSIIVTGAWGEHWLRF